MHNLSLDFLNPESRKILRIYENYSDVQHQSYIGKLLNLYVIWCKDYCISQPGVLLECIMTENVFQKKCNFITERLIRIPLGTSIPSFVDERRREYADHSAYFPDLYQERILLLERYPEIVMPKLVRTGPSLAQAWEKIAGGVSSTSQPAWARGQKSDDLLRIAPLPSGIIQRGNTLTWPDLENGIIESSQPIDLQTARLWLQHLYLDNYLSSFELRAISNLPGSIPQLGNTLYELEYDYDAIKFALNHWGIFNIILEMTDLEIIEMRQQIGFLQFRDLFRQMSEQKMSSTDIQIKFARSYQKLGFKRQQKFKTDLEYASPDKKITTLNDVINEVVFEVVFEVGNDFKSDTEIKNDNKQSSKTFRSEDKAMDKVNTSEHLVVLIHGIRTRAHWMHIMRSAVEEEGFRPVQTSYGRYNLIKFLLPGRKFRNKAVENVVKDIRTAQALYRPERISVFAHSFGTYVFAEILRQHSDIDFHRVILCGSVLNENFRLDLYRNRFETPLLNEVGTKDFLPALAESVGWDYGSIGSNGLNDPQAITRWWTGYRHSDFLTKSFFKLNVAPFFKNGIIPPGDDPQELPFFIRLLVFLPLRWLIIIIFIFLLFYIIANL